MSQFLSLLLEGCVQRLDAGHASAWDDADAALVRYPEDDVELFVAIDDRDKEALRAMVLAWASGKRSLPLHDRNLLKRALKDFRKRLKLMRLDAESTVGGGPTSGGRQSGIIGVRPPDQYPQEVWDMLVRQKRLKEGRDGTYELPPE